MPRSHRDLPSGSSSGPSAIASIRSSYQSLGARRFYEQSGSDYRNPHESAVVEVIYNFVRRHEPDLSHVLDLAAGSGEVTLALREMGAGSIDGIDPYTAAAYLARTGSNAETFTFADIADGALTGRRYSLVACSFALHLCEKSRLPAVVQQLREVADALLIITPHKRPEIRPAWGWNLVDEQVLHRVRSRYYRKS